MTWSFGAWKRKGGMYEWMYEWVAESFDPNNGKINNVGGKVSICAMKNGGGATIAQIFHVEIGPNPFPFST